MAVDAQNTPDVIQEMRKPEGIDLGIRCAEAQTDSTGTTVKSPEPYLSPDQIEVNMELREQVAKSLYMQFHHHAQHYPWEPQQNGFKEIWMKKADFILTLLAPVIEKARKWDELEKLADTDADHCEICKHHVLCDNIDPALVCQCAGWLITALAGKEADDDQV